MTRDHRAFIKGIYIFSLGGSVYAAPAVCQLSEIFISRAIGQVKLTRTRAHRRIVPKWPKTRIAF